ncbi:MAG: CHC2 zinc finger domain-containing protein, partial [Pseudomonadota bacterium]
MAGRIPKQFIDDLITRVDIVELIDERVPLKKAGKDYKANCPFHEEKTPSFT